MKIAMDTKTKIRVPLSREEFKNNVSKFLDDFFPAMGAKKTQENESKISSIKQKICDLYESLDYRLPKEEFQSQLKSKLDCLEKDISDDVTSIIGTPDKPIRVDMESILKNFRSVQDSMIRVKETNV